MHNNQTDSVPEWFIRVYILLIKHQKTFSITLKSIFYLWVLGKYVDYVCCIEVQEIKQLSNVNIVIAGLYNHVVDAWNNYHSCMLFFLNINDVAYVNANNRLLKCMYYTV